MTLNNQIRLLIANFSRFARTCQYYSKLRRIPSLVSRARLGSARVQDKLIYRTLILLYAKPNKLALFLHQEESNE